MFANKTWITNGTDKVYKKVKNPAKYPDVTDKYEGPLVSGFDFKHQTANWEKIKTSLEPWQIYPTEIYFANRAGKSSFVVLFSNPDIIWNKYEGEGYGSGQNLIYFKDKKIKTTLWITYSEQKIGQILAGQE